MPLADIADCIENIPNESTAEPVNISLSHS